MDIYIECLLSLLLSLAGALQVADGYKPIFSSDEHPLNAFHRMFGPRLDTAKVN
jgi:hypothetical protein